MRVSEGLPPLSPFVSRLHWLRLPTSTCLKQLLQENVLLYLAIVEEVKDAAENGKGAVQTTHVCEESAN